MQSPPKDLRTFLKILDDRWAGEVLRVDTRGKTFDLAGCDAAAFLAKLKAGGKRPLTLFRGFKTLGGKLWPGELLFSELATLRNVRAASLVERRARPDPVVPRGDLAVHFAESEPSASNHSCHADRHLRAWQCLWR